MGFHMQYCKQTLTADDKTMSIIPLVTVRFRLVSFKWEEFTSRALGRVIEQRVPDQTQAVAKHALSMRVS
jgi:uncharacterized BrkB/YihY/UPF0761 family membrane protein